MRDAGEHDRRVTAVDRGDGGVRKLVGELERAEVSRDPGRDGVRSGGLVKGDFERGAWLDDQGAGFVGENSIAVGHFVSCVDIVGVVIEGLGLTKGLGTRGKEEYAGEGKYSLSSSGQTEGLKV